jgi:hypothetical protein
MAAMTPARTYVEINARAVAVPVVIGPTIAVVAIAAMAVTTPTPMMAMTMPSTTHLLDLGRRVGPCNA